MKISVYAIEKSPKDEFDAINQNFKKMSGKYATITSHSLFSKKLSSITNPKLAQEEYARIYEKHLGVLNIALDPLGKVIDSHEFSRLLSDQNDVRFFIGGAYGFNKQFLSKCHKVISLSKLTFAHKIAKTILYEQIYRGLSITNNHPYHK